MQHVIRLSVKVSGSVHVARVLRAGRVVLASGHGASKAAAVAEAVRNFRMMIRAER